jgi:hypothetical protein
VIRTLWQAPAFLDYVQPRLTPDLVRGAEAQLHVRLPSTYVEMLEVQNGGYLRATWPGLPHRRLDGIGTGFPSLTSVDAWWYGADASAEDWVPAQSELLVPFDGDGDWDLCFDYRARGPSAEPSITYIDIEKGQDVPVAESFDPFLAGLVDEVEQVAIRIYADVELEEFGRVFAAACGQPVTDEGDWNYGHRHLMANMGGPDRWAWISPNRVPAGFRRAGDRVVATAETALRLPLDDACRLLVRFTPDAAEATRAALRTTGLWDG